MLPKVEYGHLYKFAVSIGLFLIGAALAVPWLVLRESSVLNLSEPRIRTLTPTAQRVISRKQSDYAWIVSHHWYASVALAIVGVLLIGYGLLKWRERQLVADEMEDTERDTAKERYRQMSPAEVEQKYDQDAAVAVENESAAEVPAPPEATVIPATHTNPKDVRIAVERAEALVTAKLADAFAMTHSLRKNVAIQGSVGRAADKQSPVNTPVELDALLLPIAPTEPTLVVEINWAASQGSVVRRLRAALLAVENGVSIIERDPPTSEVWGLAMVIRETDVTLQKEFDTSQLIESLQRPNVAALVLSRQRLEEMTPRQLRTVIENLFLRNEHGRVLGSPLWTQGP